VRWPRARDRVRSERIELTVRLCEHGFEFLLDVPPTLGRTQYVILMRVASPTARAFYEIEAAREAWSTRQLERPIGSRLFDRLANNRDWPRAGGNYQVLLDGSTGGTRQVRRPVQHYLLEAILAVGFRVCSHRGTQFRKWANARLSEYLVKGFAMDDERLKNPPGEGHTDYFDELLERIRDIRASERRFYQKVLDIYATSIEYHPDTDQSYSRYSASVIMPTVARRDTRSG